MKEFCFFEDLIIGKWLMLEEEMFFIEGILFGCLCRFMGWLVVDGRVLNVWERYRFDDWNEFDVVGIFLMGRMEFGRDINLF